MTDRQPRLPYRAIAFGSHGKVFLLCALAGMASFAYLELSPSDFLPTQRGLRSAAQFFSHALHPAMQYEDPISKGQSASLPENALLACLYTIVFAASAMCLAIPLGLVLAFLCSSRWWRDFTPDNRDQKSIGLRLPLILTYRLARISAAALRSIHELLWAVLLLAAFGLSPLAAIIAMALPTAGILAKIYSELLEETTVAPAAALRATGAGKLQSYVFGCLPLAAADMISYTLYRFECCLRSSAVLGFFGFPTLGYYISASFENLYYGEVWTYLYVLIALLAAMDLWSAAVRKRLVV